MTALALATLIALSPVSAPDTFDTSGTCGRGDPISVLRIHHKGSSVPKRIETWDLDRYVAAVMASGAWPNRVWESAKVGALAIRQYATWMARHTHRTWKGRCYDISDQEQYLRADVRPSSPVPVRSLRAVRAMLDVSLTKSGRTFRTGWSGGRCNDGWHLCEDTVRDLAERGWGWRRIVRTLLAPVRIVGDWR